MPKTEIETHDAQTLPYDLRDRVLEECRKKAKLNPAFAMFYLLFTVIFVFITFNILSFIFAFQGGSVIMWVIGLMFIITPIMMTYILYVRPRQILKMAEQDDYTYYIGRLTDKKMYTSRSNGHTHHTYYLYIDDVIKCSCSASVYSHAKIGEQYIALYFHKNAPEMCFEITCNEAETYTYDQWNRYQ